MTATRIAASLRHIRRGRGWKLKIRADVAASAPDNGSTLMPLRNPSRRIATRLVLFTLAGWTLWALGKNSARDEAAATSPETAPDPWELDVELDAVGPAPPASRSSFSRRRMATSLAFVTLFFAGAAFSAGAGDAVVAMVEGSTETEAPVTTTEEAAQAPAPETEAPAEAATSAEDEPQTPAETAAEPAGTAATAEQQGAEAPASETASSEPAATAAEQTAPEPTESVTAAAPDEGDGSAASAAESRTATSNTGAGTEPAPEVEGEAGLPTVWLHRTLPDPTPPAKRLSPTFARRLRVTSARADVDWALVLGVLRARGENGSQPGTRPALQRLANRLAKANGSEDPWKAALALSGRTSFADRAVALMRYNRAVGLRALVTGLQAAKPALQARVLGDPRLDVYAGGRVDVASGRVDVRVLVLMLYLAEAHGQVTVSSLYSGHRLYARPGVVSAHVHGLAVDVSGLEGQPIAGNQAPGGLTERAVRNVLLLPAELRPQQVISLLGLGGPSFPLGDHGDHLHVGY